jgi:hypothetical protein
MTADTTEATTIAANERGAKFAKDYLRGEKDSADRRIERRGDSRSGATRHERAYDRNGSTRHLTEHRSNRRADLYDWPFATAASAESNRNRRGKRLDGNDAGVHSAAAQRDRLHDLRNAMALRLRRETRSDVSRKRSADGKLN